METVETFVTLSIHEGKNAEGKSIRFIRARFQVGAGQYLTAFNPFGIGKIELIRRVSRTTGYTRVQSRWPVLVRFTRDSVVGSDVVSKCIIEPRAFTPTAMQSAPEADLAALDAVGASQVAKPAQAPAVPPEPEEEALA